MEEALSKLENTAVLASQRDDEAAEASAHRKLCHAYREVARLEESIREGLVAKDICERRGLWSELVLTLIELAKSRLQHDDASGAFGDLQDAEGIASTHDLRVELADVLIASAFGYSESGLPERSLESVERAFTSPEALPTVRQVDLLNTRAGTLIQLGRFEEADLDLDWARALLQSEPNEAQILSILTKKALVQGAKEGFDAVLKTVQEAEAISQTGGAPAMAHFYETLGLWYVAAGRAEEATHF
ncbi:hypothetical protein BH11ARM2_BH11ARM2_32410 [soil metagenome]